VITSPTRTVTATSYSITVGGGGNSQSTNSTSGTEILSTTISLSGTADTVNKGLLKTDGSTILSEGDRLALKDAGTLTSQVGLSVTITIRYI